MPCLMRSLPASMEMDANGAIAGFSRADTLKITGDPGGRNVACLPGSEAFTCAIDREGVTLHQAAIP